VTGPGPLAQGHDLTELAVPPRPVVRLACTACQLVYEPDFAAFDTGNTGCPRCGGWTWIAQLGASPSDHAPLTATGGGASSVVGEGDLR
jgi:hypothetical protein